MAGKTLSIKLMAEDLISAVFKKVGDSSKTLGEVLEAAGKEGKQGLEQVEQAAKEADQALDKVGTSAKTASLSFSDFEVAATAIGAGLTYAGNAALDQQQTIIGLQAAYGDAADEMILFADQMAATSIFNDDDILRGERYFATLRQNYGLTIDQIQELMQVTADLASASGTSFEDASSRVTAAIRGEGEAAEYLGLTMNQQAIDRENLTLSMSNQEAAQFRLNALYEQSAAYAGTAQTLAESEVGTRARLTNALQDNAQALGDFIGPIGTMVGGVGLAVSGLTSMTGTLGKVATSARNSQRVMSALSLTTNPLALGLGALTGAGVLAWNMFQEGEEKAQRLEGALLSLGDVADNLRLSHLDEQAQYVDDFARQVEEVTGTAASMLDDGDFLIDKAKQIAQESGGNWSEIYSDLAQAYALSSEEAEAFAAAQDRIGAAFADNRVNHDALDAALDELHKQYLLGDLTLDGYVQAVEGVSQRIDDFRIASDDATTSATGFAAALGLVRPELEGMVESFLAFNEIGEEDTFFERFIKTLDLDLATLSEAEVRTRRLMGAWSDLGEMPAPDASQEEWMAWVNQAERGTIEWKRRVDAANEARAAEAAAADQVEKGTGVNDRYAESMGRIAENASAAEESVTAAGTAMAVAGTEALEALAQMEQDFIAGFLDLTGDADFLSQLNMTAVASDASLLAENINDVSTALDNATRIAIDNTDALGSQMQGLKDWSDNLIGDPGVWAEIDDLYAEGRISIEKYNEAQEAQIEITAANATAQRDILAIQSAQAPIMADLATRQAEYLETLRELNDGIDDTADGATRQMSALALMDTGIQGQVQQLFEMYDLMGQLGPEGQMAFQDIINGIIAMDPYMTSVLEDLGLIERQANGDYSINFEGFDQAASDIDNLNRTLADLIDFLDDGALNGSYKANIDLEVEGREDAEAVKQDIYDLAALGAQDHIITIATELEEPDPEGFDPTSVYIPPFRVPVELDFGGVGSAAGGLAAEGAQTALAALQNNIELSVTTSADTSAADEAIAHLAAYDGQTIATPMVMVDGDASDAIGTVQAMQGYDGMTAATAIVAVEGDASHAVGTVTAMGGYDGMVLATAYVDIVTRRSSIDANAMGGLVGYATGGILPHFASGGMVPFIGGENGPEMAYFAHGGVASLPVHGIYSAPAGTYISPNNSTASSSLGGGGLSVNVTVQGNVIGIDNLTEEVTRQIAPAIAETARNIFREQGVSF